MKKKSSKENRFTLNEPKPRIKNGNYRKSTIVTAKEFPARAYRDKINRLLVFHDNTSEAKDEFIEKDIVLLKQIAFEGAISNNIPALRYRAIEQLARFPGGDTLNTLSWLAQHGEDEYIKGYALIALGTLGLELSVPTVTKYLSDKNRVVRTAAQKALFKLVDRLGSNRVQEYTKHDRSLDNSIIKMLRHRLNRNRTKRQTKGE